MYSNVHINIITPFNLNVIFMHIKICHGHLITSNNGQIFFMQLGAFLQNVQWKTLFMIWSILMSFVSCFCIYLCYLLIKVLTNLNNNKICLYSINFPAQCASSWWFTSNNFFKKSCNEACQCFCPQHCCSHRSGTCRSLFLLL